MSIYQGILQSKSANQNLLAVLIDPDKMQLQKVEAFMQKVNASLATHIFVGGSEVEVSQTTIIVKAIKQYTSLPVILFPGDITQITDEADGLLFLSLISGRNPEYLIGKQVKAVSKLTDVNLEVISTGYILIENGKQTAVERVSETKPMPRHNIEAIAHTATAGALLGMKLIYLEAGSGATHPVTNEIIKQVKAQLSIPLIVGGGIRSKIQLDKTYNAGADLVVIGTAFEDDESFFDELKK